MQYQQVTGRNVLQMPLTSPLKIMEYLLFLTWKVKLLLGIYNASTLALSLCKKIFQWEFRMGKLLLYFKPQNVFHM